MDSHIFLVKKKYSKPNDPPIDNKIFAKINQNYLDSSKDLQKNIRMINEGTPKLM